MVMPIGQAAGNFLVCKTSICQVSNDKLALVSSQQQSFILVHTKVDGDIYDDKFLRAANGSLCRQARLSNVTKMVSVLIVSIQACFGALQGIELFFKIFLFLWGLGRLIAGIEMT